MGLLMLLFAPPLQGTASILGFLGRDVVAATGMGILTGTWLCTGAVFLATPPASTSDALGTLLVLAAVALALVASGGVRSKLLPAVVMGTAAVRFAVFAVYELTSVNAWRTAAGILGIVLCAIALVAVAALTWEDVLKRSLPPTVRRGRGRAALEAPLGSRPGPSPTRRGFGSSCRRRLRSRSTVSPVSIPRRDVSWTTAAVPAAPVLTLAPVSALLRARSSYPRDAATARASEKATQDSDQPEAAATAVPSV